MLLEGIGPERWQGMQQLHTGMTYRTKLEAVEHTALCLPGNQPCSKNLEAERQECKEQARPEQSRRTLQQLQ